MRHHFRKCLLVCGLAALGAAAAAGAADNMIGRQSQNEGLTAVPAPGPVVIDGELKDWDLSGQMWSFADVAVRDRFSVKTAAMWDKDYLYLSYLWKDPTRPMFSTVNPAFDPSRGWTSDAIQMRVTADGQSSWFTTWPFVPDTAKPEVVRPVLHLSYWKNEARDKDGQDIRMLIAEPGSVDLGEGAQMAYKVLPEKDGFVQEMRIPWALVYNKPHVGTAGDVFKMGMEFLWGPDSGDTWPIHRYADNMMPGATSREFFWTAKKSWGEITLADKGGLEPRLYVEGDNAPKGVVPVRAVLPVGEGGLDRISGFTLVVENAEGRRVRNLAGDFDPREFAVKGAPAGTVEVLWDGLDDAGKLVAPGEYKVRGLVHGALGADYERCFYNPGIPPWGLANGKGAWGADHAIARYAARAGDMMAVGWGFAEGGHGLIGIGPDGVKVWGEKRGVGALAANAEYVYAVPNTWHTKEQELLRLNAKNGTYAPFVLDGKKRKLELPVAEVLAGTPLADAEKTGDVAALAADAQRIAMVFGKGAVALLDAESAKVVATYDAPAGAAAKADPAAAVGTGVDQAIAESENPDKADTLQVATAAFSADGKTLYLGLNSKVTALNLDTKERRTVELAGMVKPAGLAVDGEGLLWVYDQGPDKQVKAYDAAGAQKFAVGQKGGRPIRGAFQPQAMMNVAAIAVDAAGDVWATEYWDYPRRVSVWKRDTGALVRDYIGNTGYAGTGTFLHDSDPTRAYVGPIEIAFDTAPGSRAWSVKDILWVPDKAQGESFTIGTGNHANPTVSYSAASGQKREYMFVPGYRDYQGFVILMKEGEAWRPVSAIGTVGTAFGRFAANGSVAEPAGGAFAGTNLFDGLIWNDKNKDGKVQRDECEIVPAKKPGDNQRRGENGIALMNGWGARLDPATMNVYASDGVAGVVEYRPLEWTAEGAPVYGVEGMRPVGYKGRGEVVPVPGRDTLLFLTGGKLAGVDRKTGAETWTYPNLYHSVHGSHRATMPKPGLVIGPLKIMGVVDADKPDGGFFALRGNLGQDFYLTTDGLFIGAMFLDGRLPGMGLPGTEDQLAAMPMEMYSNGGEPFNGWLGRQSDGVLRMTNGLPRQASMVNRLRGFETVQRFAAPNVDLTPELLAKAEEDNLLRKQAAEAATEYKIKRKPGKGWDGVPSLAVIRPGQPARALVQLAYDGKNLHARFEVQDPSPWKNNGKDVTQLFKTGDCVDIQMSPTANNGRAPAAGDQRIVIAPFNRKPTAVLMRQEDPNAKPEERVRYHSPVMDVFFAKAAPIADAKVDVEVDLGKYVVEATIPWAALGMEMPKPDQVIRGDVGFILSDEAGTMNTARLYWNNQSTNLVNDLAAEAKLEPVNWGVMRFE